MTGRVTPRNAQQGFALIEFQRLMGRTGCVKTLNAQQGFTLIEMLVAIGLLSLLGLASALALNSALNSQATIKNHQAALEQLQRTQRMLSRDLEQILTRQGRSPQGDPLDAELIAFAQADTSQDGLLLQFFKTGRRLLNQTRPQSRLEQVRYRIEDDNLLRESTPLLDPAAMPRWHAAVLLRDIRDIRLRFFDDQQWHTQWPPLNQPANAEQAAGQLPKAIGVELETALYDNVVQLILLPESF